MGSDPVLNEKTAEPPIAIPVQPQPAETTDHSHDNDVVAPLRTFSSFMHKKGSKPQSPTSGSVEKQRTPVSRHATPRYEEAPQLAGPGVESDLAPVTSRPPIASPFGSASPDPDDPYYQGWPAVRSQEEADARDLRRMESRRSHVSRMQTPQVSRPLQAEGSETSTAVEKSDEDWMVKFEEGDPKNPKNWSVGYRWYLTMAAALLVLNSTFASSAPAGVVEGMIEYFGFGTEVATLTIALFIAGYCVGPLLWGPASESYGRRPVFLVAFLFYTGFQVGCALSKNTASILIFRLLSGIFAACPLTNAGALLADVWDADRRGMAMAIFSLAPFAGPAIGPIVGGYIQVSGTSWRWLYWVLALFAGFCFFLILVSIPETYTPILIEQKAIRMRKETGETQWWAPLERKEHTLSERARDILVTPFKILFLEPMLQAITIYMSFVYGCIYMLFEAFPIVFGRDRGFNAGEQGLMFLGFFLGGLTSTIVYIVYFDRRYKKKSKHHHPGPVPPEARLEMTLLSAPLFVIAFLWFGWTSFPGILWVSPCLAGMLLGFATLGIFVSLFNYIVDTYLFAAASALAANTVCRSIFGASFPLFATQMFEALNPRYASTLLAGVALILAPIPFVLIKYGPTLRAKSRFSPKAAVKK